MKKAAFCVLLPSMVMLFSSCTLHLGEYNINLPWQVMTILVVIPSLLITFFVAWGSTEKNRKGFYVCSHCQHRFKPGWRVLYSPHVNDEYVLTCPHCGKRDWCSMSYDQEE